MKIRPVPQKLLLCLLLCLVALLAYWPVVRCGFINFDDTDYVTENLNVQTGLTLPSIAWAFGTGHAGNWHPLTWISHMLDVQLYGLHPAGHHLTSLLFHVANTVLLFLLLLRMTAAQPNPAPGARTSCPLWAPFNHILALMNIGRVKRTGCPRAGASVATAGAVWRSAFVAALFALHPTHVESVAWVAERKDVLSAFFGFLSLLAYARYAEQSKVLSLRSKVQSRELGGRSQEMGDTGQEIEGRGQNAESGFRQHATLFYLLSLSCFALGLMSKPMLVTLPFVLLLLDYWPLRRLELKTPDSRLQTLFPLVLEKLPFFLLSALSSTVTFFIQRAAGATVSTAELSLPGRAANVLVSYVRYLGKLVWPADLAVFYPRPAQWPGWQVAGSALVLVLLTLLAVRLLARARFVPVGWFWFVGTLVPVIGLVQVGEQAMADRYTYLPSIGFFILIAWGAEEIARRSHRLKLLTGAAALCALAALLAATRIQTRYWQNTETLFRQAVAVTQDNPTAQEILGSALCEAGNLPEAELHCLEALRLRPDFAEAEITYASVLARQGKFAEAHTRLAEVLRKNPREASAHFSLAQALNLSGDTAQAIDQYREGLRLKPDHADALNNLAWIRAAHPNPAFRNGGEAVRLAQRACELTRYERPIMIGTLAAAYAEAGRFDEAIATAQRAGALARASGQEDLAVKNQRLLELYQAHQPYHEPAGP